MAEDDVTRSNTACLECGGAIQDHGPRRERVFCSRDCKSKHHGRKYRQKNKTPDPKCKVCGAVFARLSPRHCYCSDACKKAAARDVARKRRKAGTLPKYYSGVYCKVSFCRCGKCGKSYCARGSQSKKICAECISLYGYYVAYFSAYGSVTTSCKFCGIAFSRLPGISNKSQTCSLKCSEMSAKSRRRANESARRAKKRSGDVFDPVEIFERDGWKCSSCGTPTPQKLRGTYRKNAPHLDHILPICCGGEHSRANVQLLCASCNWRKGGGSLNDQMLLFG